MDSSTIKDLHSALLTFWNQQDGRGMASLFSANGNVIGFDGSQMNGTSQIESELVKIFSSHKTSKYVWKVREVRFLTENVAILRAVVGMTPPGKADIKPDVNAIQSLVAVLQSGVWRISLFQNTPAKFDGRPDLAENLTQELRQLIAS